MYVNVETGSTCSDLVFSLSADASVQRSWAIKITQYSCDYINKAPEGCLQWFFGSTTGTIQSFNWANKQHLADQNQNICIRRESGQCQICYTQSSDDDFKVYYLNRKLSTQNSSSESQWNVTIFIHYISRSAEWWPRSPLPAVMEPTAWQPTTISSLSQVGEIHSCMISVVCLISPL